ncbi:MAG: threonine synthase, partial [Lachnospiraceae bacterium]|nr:threonine synthase [Lachnospiraceae bacterium]
MKKLSQGGVYTITEEMRGKLSGFYGNYASEEETAKTIRGLYDRTGYVIDTHTAVASCVYEKYKEETKDRKRAVIASTASPYKFTRSVMEAIDCEHAQMGDFELADRLSELSKVKVPKAIEEIRTAPVVHDHVCEKTEMKKMVMNFLKI